MLHTTPLAVTAAPPLFVTFPPETAELPVIEVMAVVVTVGTVVESVVTVISFP